ncbi:hypothetical protein HF086_003493 [Spodoptera exigua]|uniref:Uncharacterized protein n=1 Tax=Spodoptera exigua TaxID=7107 RepID=A0A922MZ96_SPOEX|nr:hypothetical protein HF086_003493 [Spodoptera exigua]
MPCLRIVVHILGTQAQYVIYVQAHIIVRMLAQVLPNPGAPNLDLGRLPYLVIILMDSRGVYIIVLLLFALGTLRAISGVRTVDVQAVEGMVAQFPCDLGTAANDKVYMVFWFRDDAGIPLYSSNILAGFKIARLNGSVYHDG